MLQGEKVNKASTVNWGALLDQCELSDRDGTSTMPAEQKAYCLLGYSKIAAKVRAGVSNSSCCYLAMGPDLSTPLLTFNPTRVEGIDICDWNAEKLQQAVCQRADLSSATLPSANVMLARQRRRSEGFWSCHDLERLKGWYQPLLLELLSLGVNPAKVRCTQLAANSVQLDFPWSHPIEGKMRERTIVLNGKVNLQRFLQQQRNSGKFSYYLDKGINLTNFGYQFDRATLSAFFRPQSIFVSSFEYNSPTSPSLEYLTCVERLMDPELLKRAERINFSDENWQRVDIEMKQCFPLFGWGYSWKMKGYLVNQQN